MGQMLDKPILDKESGCGAPSGALGLAWASSCMQGWRLGMEDAHICLPSLPTGAMLGAPEAEGWRGLALFGVLDGHGGEQVAKFCERHLPEELCKFPLNGRSHSDLAAALTGAFHRMDELLQDRRSSGPELKALTNKPVPQAAQRMAPMQNSAAPNPDLIGCTACVCCITDRHIVVANAGDSRAVLCRDGCAVPLSTDHKPNDPRERQRIEAAGGTVENSGPGQWRVNGNLNLSRALGDLTYKKDGKRQPQEQIICSTPDVTFQGRSPEDEYVVICCDGVWDVMSNQEVVDFVSQRLPRGGRVTAEGMVPVLEALLNRCVSPNLRQTEGLGGDNMTAVIVDLKGGLVQAGAPAQELPRLASIRHQPLSAGGGALVVELDVPPCYALRDLFLHVSEVAATLRVGVKGQSAGQGGLAAAASRLIELAAHLPDGAVLSSPEACAERPSAKFFRKVSKLVIRLPWQLSS